MGRAPTKVKGKGKARADDDEDEQHEDDRNLDILAGVASTRTRNAKDGGRVTFPATTTATTVTATSAGEVDVQGTTDAALLESLSQLVEASPVASTSHANVNVRSGGTTKLDRLRAMDEAADEAMQLNDEYQSSVLKAMAKLAESNERVDELQQKIKAVQSKLLAPSSNAVTIIAPGTDDVALPWFKHFYSVQLPKNDEGEARDAYISATRPGQWAQNERRALKSEVQAQNGRWLLEHGSRVGQRYEEALASVGGEQWLLTNTDNLDWSKVSLAMPRRSAAECRIQWLYNDHPLINRSKWTKDEQNRMYEIADAHEESPRQWAVIAEELGTQRTPFDCLMHFRRRILPGKNWTPEEDANLKDAVRLYGENWQSVARYVGRHSNACINRWTKTLRPTIKRGKWTPEEDEALRQAIATVGPVWKLAASRVSGRTDAQCRERWVNILNPALRPKNDWTKEEDDELVRLRDEEGKSWSEIANMTNGSRTDNHCSMRYNQIKRRKQKRDAAEAAGEGDQAGDAANPKKRAKKATGKRRGRPAASTSKKRKEPVFEAPLEEDERDELEFDASHHGHAQQVVPEGEGEGLVLDEDLLPPLDPALLAHIAGEAQQQQQEEQVAGEE